MKSKINSINEVSNKVLVFQLLRTQQFIVVHGQYFDQLRRLHYRVTVKCLIFKENKVVVELEQLAVIAHIET